MFFAGGQNTCITNPRWRTAAVLEKSKNRHISATVWPIATKLAVTQFDHLDPPESQNSEIFKNPRWQRPPFCKIENSPYLSNEEHDGDVRFQTGNRCALKNDSVGHNGLSYGADTDTRFHRTYFLLLSDRIAVLRTYMKGVAWSVGLSVCHHREPWKNGWTDRVAVWVANSGGCMKPYEEPDSLPANGQFWWGRGGPL